MAGFGPVADASSVVIIVVEEMARREKPTKAGQTP